MSTINAVISGGDVSVTVNGDIEAVVDGITIGNLGDNSIETEDTKAIVKVTGDVEAGTIGVASNTTRGANLLSM